MSNTKIQGVAPKIPLRVVTYNVNNALGFKPIHP